MIRFKEVLNQMDDIFTSNSFTTKCREMNVSDILLDNGLNHRAIFLKKHCIQVGGYRSKTWEKRVSKKPNQTLIKFEKIEPNEKDCINYLKKLGYKIYKTVEI